MILPDNLNESVAVKCNTEDPEIRANMRHACSLDLPWLQVEQAHSGVAVIVGGGPSLVGSLPMIIAHRAAGHKVFAINGTMKFQIENGVGSDYFVLLDARPENLSFLDYLAADKYLIASQCHPKAFDLLADEDVTLWHASHPVVVDYIGDRECALIGGGTTVGLLTMGIAHAMGFREIHLYGFDSSFAEDAGHAYSQPQNDSDLRADYWLCGQKFVSTPWMVRQAMEFQNVAAAIANDGGVIHVHGSGLLPAIAKQMQAPPESLTVLTVYRSGGAYTKEYVTRLRDGVAAHLTFPYRFVCMTDDPVDGVECIPFELGLPGWWSKPEIFRPDLPFDRVLYLDLSCVVTGLLDDMAMQEGICITSDWYHGGPSQSVLLYNVGDFANLWEAFSRDPSPWMTEGDKMIAPNFGDQILVRDLQAPQMKYWQDVIPGQLVSYKVHCQGSIPPDARLVKFHGQPKPADVNWLQQPERQKAYG
jgi:hypothetical protein